MPGRSKQASTSSARSIKVRPSVKMPLSAAGTSKTRALITELGSCCPFARSAASVGPYDPLADPTGRPRRRVLVRREGAGAMVALPVGQQVSHGPQDPTDAVARVPGTSALPAGVLLDALSASVQGVPGQSEHAEGVHDCDRGGELLGGGGLETGEPVHRDHLGPLPESGRLLVHPGKRDRSSNGRGSCPTGGNDRFPPGWGDVDDDRDEAVSARGVAPHILVHADHPDPVDPGRVMDEQLGRVS